VFGEPMHVRQAGYREGIDAGKSQTVQAGFDVGKCLHLAWIEMHC